jgi:tRNA A-37 threonylcarbamoyl transferase component Bud32
MSGVEIGAKIGKFEILDEIGQGGMSVVYRGRHLQLEREVAIKVLHRFLADQPDARKRFLVEAKAVARLEHPHIITIHDYSDDQAEASYIVTELVEGRTLSSLLADGPVAPPEAALVLGRCVADALSHAHDAGVIHRDLKPENVLVGSGGVLKLTDFGIARLLDTESLTVTGTLLGSPAYMAPEYINGEIPDARADIFSFGAMMYQLVTGKLPFAAPSPHALLKRIAAGEYTPADQENPKTHALIARMIRRCMANRPEDRYGSAAELLAEIDQLLQRLGLAPDEERHRLLADPTAYAGPLEARLLHTYLQLGRDAFAAGRTGEAMQHFDRVLSIDPEHAEVRRILLRLSRRHMTARVARAVALGVAGAAAAVAIAAGWTDWQASRPPPASEATRGGPTAKNVAFVVNGTGDLYVDGLIAVPGLSGSDALLLEPGEHVATLVGAEKSDVQPFVVDRVGPVSPVTLDVRVRAAPAPQPQSPPQPADAGTRAEPINRPVRQVEFKPAGQWVTLYVDGRPEPVVTEQMRVFRVPLTYGSHRLRFTNDKAQPLEQDIVVSDTEPPETVIVRLKPLDAKLRVTGAPDGSVVEVAKRRFVINERTRDDPIFVPLPEGQGRADLEVVVRSRDGAQEHLRRRVTFRAGEELTLAVGDKPL